MIIGKHINSLLKEYFSDVADIDSNTKSLNDTMMAGLSALGYTGALNTRLKSFWSDLGGAGNSLNTLMKTALESSIDTTVSSVNDLLKELTQYNTWSTIKTKWNYEMRKLGRID